MASTAQAVDQSPQSTYGRIGGLSNTSSFLPNVSNGRLGNARSTRLSAEKGKRFLLYKNGDAYYAPKRATLDLRVKDVDQFLALVSTKFEGYGPLRRLYTLSGMRVNSLSEIEGDAAYVVAKAERFKSIPYKDVVGDTTRQWMLRREGEQKIAKGFDPKVPHPEVLQRLKQRWRPIAMGGATDEVKVIYLLRNGVTKADRRHVPAKLVLTKRNMMTLDQVCTKISSKWPLHCPTLKLYTLHGEPIKAVHELLKGSTYVTVGCVPFRQAAYAPAAPPERPRRKVKLAPVVRKVESIPTVLEKSDTIVLVDTPVKQEKQAVKSGTPVVYEVTFASRCNDPRNCTDVPVWFILKGDHASEECHRQYHTLGHGVSRMKFNDVDVGHISSVRCGTYDHPEDTVTIDRITVTVSDIHGIMVPKTFNIDVNRRIGKDAHDPFDCDGVHDYNSNEAQLDEAQAEETESEEKEDSTVATGTLVSDLKQIETTFLKMLGDSSDYRSLWKAISHLLQPDDNEAMKVLKDFDSVMKILDTYWKILSDRATAKSTLQFCNNVYFRKNSLAESLSKRELRVFLLVHFYSTWMNAAFCRDGKPSVLTVGKLGDNHLLNWGQLAQAFAAAKNKCTTVTVNDLALHYAKLVCAEAFKSKKKKSCPSSTVLNSKKRESLYPGSKVDLTSEKAGRKLKDAKNFQQWISFLQQCELDPELNIGLCLNINFNAHLDSVSASEAIDNLLSKFDHLFSEEDIHNALRLVDCGDTVRCDELLPLCAHTAVLLLLDTATSPETESCTFDSFLGLCRLLPLDSLTDETLAENFDSHPENIGGQLQSEDVARLLSRLLFPSCHTTPNSGTEPMRVWRAEQTKLNRNSSESSSSRNSQSTSNSVDIFAAQNKSESSLRSHVPESENTPLAVLSNPEFDELETQFQQIVIDVDRLSELWDQMDNNDNDRISLAEIDRIVTERYPLLNCKPALMRAYRQTTLEDGGDGDVWVEPDEFPQLLSNIFYFNKLYAAFSTVDSDSDHRISVAEFKAGISSLGMMLSDEEADAEFHQIDSNDGNFVLFDEFCIWFIKKHQPSRDAATVADQFKESRKTMKSSASDSVCSAENSTPQVKCP